MRGSIRMVLERAENEALIANTSTNPRVGEEGKLAILALSVFLAL